MYGYKLDKSRNEIEPVIKDKMKNLQIGASDIAVFFPNGQPEAKPILVLCKVNIELDNIVGEITQSDLEVIKTTKYYACWGNEKLGGRYRR